jgi:hypothetical protein
MADDLLVVSRLVLVIAFAATAAGSIIRPHATSELVIRCVMVVELLAAVGLLSHATAWGSAILALGCLLVPVVWWLIRPGDEVEALPGVLRSFALAIPTGLVIVLGRPHAGPDAVQWLTSLGMVQLAAVSVGIALLTAACLVSLGSRGPRYPAPPTALPSPDALPLASAPRPAPALLRPGPQLTIGMATYDDFDGVYFTIQALRLYHDLEDTELLVIDNYGCAQTESFVRGWARGRYVLAKDVVGTAAPRDLVFRQAHGAAVLCCDSHVLFAPGAIARLKRFYREHPDCGDLLQGPLVYDDGELISTHLDPIWRQHMWGIWATDERGLDRDGEPFEIPMQGLGVFSCRREAWPGFHSGFRGFGGEEGYLHEKFRQSGRRCLCLPWLRWMHRFGRPRGVPYPLIVEDKLRNYLLGHAELGLDPEPVLSHFAQYLPAERISDIAARTNESTPAVARTLR